MCKIVFVLWHHVDVKSCKKQKKCLNKESLDRKMEMTRLNLFCCLEMLSAGVGHPHMYHQLHI